MRNFRIVIYSWIPQPEVSNPLHHLSALMGPGGRGAYFGGDNLQTPPKDTDEWGTQTYRAKQVFEFSLPDEGGQPQNISKGSVKPGITTVLDGTRQSGGRVVHSLQATVTKSIATVKWNEANRWCEVRMQGAAQDPVPAESLKSLFGSIGSLGSRVPAIGSRTAPIGSSLGSMLTPNLEWDLTLRIMKGGGDLPDLERAQESYGTAGRLDLSKIVRGGRNTFDLGQDWHIGGTMRLRKFPSYVVYLSVGPQSGVGARTLMIYFSDATSRSVLDIVWWTTDTLDDFYHGA